MDPSRQELNPYWYAAGNPIMYVDPSGLTAFCMESCTSNDDLTGGDAGEDAADDSADLTSSGFDDWDGVDTQMGVGNPPPPDQPTLTPTDPVSSTGAGGSNGAFGLVLAGGVAIAEPTPFGEVVLALLALCGVGYIADNIDIDVDIDFSIPPFPLLDNTGTPIYDTPIDGEYSFEELILALILMEPQNLTIPPDFVQQEYDLSDLILQSVSVDDHVRALNSLSDLVALRDTPMPDTGGMCQYCALEDAIDPQYYNQPRAIIEFDEVHTALGFGESLEKMVVFDNSLIGQEDGVGGRRIHITEYMQEMGFSNARLSSVDTLNNYFQDWLSGAGEW